MSKPKKVYPDPMQCDTCKQFWPLEFFPRHWNGRGHSLSCDTCLSEGAIKVRRAQREAAA